MLIEYLNFIKSQELFPVLGVFFLTVVCALALLGLVGHPAEVDARGEHRTHLQVIGGLHYANNYGTFYRKVKNFLRYP